MTDATETRLYRARKAFARLAERADLDSALIGQDVQDALLSVAQALGQLGQHVLSENLDQLMRAVRENRAAAAAAHAASRQDAVDLLRAYEDALTDHLQTLLLAQANATRQQDRRLDVLDAIVLGSPLPAPAEETPPPGNDDPDESHP